MSRKKTNGKGFALGALVGGLFGSVTALMLAPKSGKKMRKDIAKNYQKGSDKAQAMMGDMRDQSAKICKKTKCLAEDAKKSASKVLKRKR